MENRFQYVLLITFGALCFGSQVAKAQDIAQSSKVGTEFLEIGVSVGTVNIESFPTTFSKGINFTLRATEDFFLEMNYLVAEDVELSNYEENVGAYFSDNQRDFEHYDLLLGYNLFQGEFFAGEKASLSSMYVVGGVGETTFGGEKRITTTLGVGYQIAFSRRYIVHFDMRDHIYKSSTNEQNEIVQNFEYSTGLSYLF